MEDKNTGFLLVGNGINRAFEKEEKALFPKKRKTGILKEYRGRILSDNFYLTAAMII